MPSATIPEPRGAACVVCGKPVTADYKPFCSQGCKDRDLLQWLSDGYRIPGAAAGEDEEEASLGLDRNDDGT
jgi:endogenous inhibitor of DNA gyrase (YacG/DUF329 family)